MSDIEYIGNKIQLYPTDEQKDIIKRYFGIMRYIYNFAIEIESEYFKNTNKILSQFDINNLFTEFKNKPENSWLLEYDSTTMKIALWDAVNAFKMYLAKKCDYPKYKSKKSIAQSMAIRADRLTIGKSSVKISKKIGTILCGHIPKEYCIGKSSTYKDDPRYREYYNPRITFDGENYYLSFTMKKSDNMNFSNYDKMHNIIENSPYSDTIGIDLGCSKTNWIVDSNGIKIQLPNIDKESKKIKRLQTKLNRQYNINASRLKKCDGIRTKNMDKTICKINKYYRKKYNRKLNEVHNYVSHNIIALNPQAVVIEDLKVSDMLIKDTSRIPMSAKQAYNANILEHCLYKVQEIIVYKCQMHGIPIIRADKKYPSTNRCSSCGNIHNIGARKIYRCPVCGLVINRDDNAAKNLAIYPTLNFV